MTTFRKTNEPIIIQNKDFKKCILFISFPIEDDDEAKIKILRGMAFDKSATYDTDKKIYEVNINNYCLSYYGRIVEIGNNNFLELALYFPSYDSLGKDVLEDNLHFIKDIIYNPYLENGTFPSKRIEDIKSIIKNNISKNFKDAMWYFKYRNDKIIDEEGYLSSKVEDNPSLLDDVTPDDLYKLYQKTTSGSPIIFLIGNVNEENARKKIKEILEGNKSEEIIFEKKYNNYCKKVPTIPEEITEKTAFKSTGVAYNYKIKDLKDEKDIALLKIVKRLLSSNSSRLLFDTLRKDNDLVYRCGAYCYTTFGTLTLWAMTGKDNIDIVQENFEKVMKKITNVNFIEEKLNLIKEEAKLNTDLVKENIYDILMQEVDKYIECKEKTFYELIKDITPSEVKTFIQNKLVLVAKFTGVGEANEWYKVYYIR